MKDGTWAEVFPASKYPHIFLIYLCGTPSGLPSTSPPIASQVPDGLPPSSLQTSLPLPHAAVLNLGCPGLRALKSPRDICIFELTWIYWYILQEIIKAKHPLQPSNKWFPFLHSLLCSSKQPYFYKSQKLQSFCILPFPISNITIWLLTFMLCLK